MSPLLRSLEANEFLKKFEGKASKLIPNFWERDRQNSERYNSVMSDIKFPLEENNL